MLSSPICGIFDVISEHIFNTVNICIFTEAVQVIYDIWFLEDEFFRDVFQAFQAIRQQAKLTRTTIPYLYNYYNVFGYYAMRSSGNKHIIGRIVNSLIVGLNTRERLPRLIVLMLDKDLVNDLNVFDHTADNQIADCLNWLFHQIEMLVHRRKMELMEKKPDAVYSSDPKIIVVDMLKRPLKFLERSTMAGILSLRAKFNLILSDAAEHFGFNRMYIETCNFEYQIKWGTSKMRQK